MSGIVRVPLRIELLWKCGNCLQYCPVGNWKERFHDTKVSNVDINQYIDDCPAVDLDTYDWEEARK